MFEVIVQQYSRVSLQLNALAKSESLTLLASPSYSILHSDAVPPLQILVHMQHDLATSTSASSFDM
jgi:hypothetical protein